MNKKRLVVLAICAVAIVIAVAVMTATPNEGTSVNPENNTAQTAGTSGTETGDAAQSHTDETASAADAVIDETTAPTESVVMGVEKGEENSDIPEGDVEVNVPTQNPGQETAPAEEETLGPDFDIYSLTYEQYQALSGQQQRAVIEMFGSPEDFLVWYEAVEAIYKAEHPEIEIDSNGNADMG